MFVPMESAFAEAVTADPGLLDFAMGLNVIVTTPTTLMSALRTIYNIWQIEYRQKNAEEIADRAGRLYEKVAGFLENMDKVDQGIGRAKAAFDEAKAQLSSGPGNVLRQVEMLKELGAKTQKTLSAGWEPERIATADPRLFADEAADDAAMIVEGRPAPSEAAE
jgi:DNA recombination protein RmuC